MVASTSGKASKKSSSQRELIYKPQAISVPDRFLPNPDYIVVDPQYSDNGLASMLNYLLSERGNNERFGGRGFNYLIKKHTKTGKTIPKDSESIYFQLNEVMAAWQEYGLCPESLLPDEPTDVSSLTLEQTQAAQKYKPLSYQRLPKDAGIMRAAIYEHHAVVVGLTAHEGWEKPLHNGIVDFQASNKILGALAVAFLGYTADGFLFQNQWGPSWGGITIGTQYYPGAALLTYPDFEAHYYGEGYVVILPDTLAVRPLLRRAGYKSDMLETEDRLDIMPDVEAVCSVLAARDVKPPLALGLFGNWGTGKSFFMARMQDEIESLKNLEKENPGGTPYCSEIVQIPFNAWHYLDANLWASLVSEIFKKLFEAVSDPQETPELIRRRVVKQLGQARGLYRQSRLELEHAKQEREIAQANLDEKAEQAATQKASLADLKDQLTKLLADDPGVQTSLKKLSKDLGVEDLDKKYSVLKAQAQGIETLSGRTRKLFSVVFDPRGRRDRLILLIGLLVGPVVIGALVSYLAQSASGLLQEIGRIVNVPTGVLVSVIALITMLVRSNKLLDSLQDAVDKVELVRHERLDAIIEPEKVKLVQTTQAEREAQARLEAAVQRVESLEKELAESSPSYQLQTFISERTSSEDYKKELGLVSLVRRDFERLSALLQTSEALEARWYERRRAAAQAGQTFNQPKRRLLPLQRIILYIDDLDRCQPDRVIEVLEAVHLLLAFPLFIVVVAVDPRWLRQCLEIHYPDLLSPAKSDEGDEEALHQPSTPQDYLEKIFQIPLYLRPINETGYRGMIDGLAGIDLAVPAAQSPATSASSGDATEVDKPAAAESPIIAPTAMAHPALENDNAGQRTKSKTTSNKLNPEQLKFQAWELQDMKRLSPLFRTPRAVKRFVNIYRLLRVSIPSSELSAFEGTAQTPGRYRVAQILLAIVSGYPNAAPRFLRRMLEMSHAANARSVTWEDFLTDCIDLAATAASAATGRQSVASTEEGKGPSQKRTTAARRTSARTARYRKAAEVAYYWQEWVQLCEVLQQISRGDFLPHKLHEYYDLVPRVARFSFSVSMLPE